jgi:Rrf2 family transcriptional regulator, cysteine metabolism repressor
MKLTTRSEYSLLALIYIARHGKDGFVRIEDICDHCAIPKKYLEQLFIVLKQNRVLKAKRGAHGGYSLAKPAAQISLAEVIRLLDGALAPTESVSTYFFSHTPLEREKRLKAVFKDIRDYIAEKLEKIPLSDFI